MLKSPTRGFGHVRAAARAARASRPRDERAVSAQIAHREALRDTQGRRSSNICEFSKSAYARGEVSAMGTYTSVYDVSFKIADWIKKSSPRFWPPPNWS